jgi:hypothetical protein
MAVARRAFVALVCAVAVGSLATDLWTLDLFGPQVSVFAALPLLSYSIVGAILVVRRAGGLIGWLLGGTGVLMQLVLLSQAYGYASLYAGAALPGGEVVLWSGSVIGNALLLLMIPAVVFFPDGRPPGRAFAVLLGVAVAGGVTYTAASALADQPILVPLPYLGLHTGEPARSIPNPFAQHGPFGDLLLLATPALYKFGGPLLLIAPLVLVFRFRRSRGGEREQLKWLMYAAGITFALMLIGQLMLPPGLIQTLVPILTVFGLGLLPVAMGIAITRYHLYDIDVLINRTLVYGATSATIALTFFAGVLALQTVVRPLTAGSELAIAASTLVSFALFQPVSRLVQSAVDRRFDRSRYDAARTLDAFADRLRDEVDLDAVRADLLSVTYKTMRPAHASVWLRERVVIEAGRTRS